jgi:hypothetical protein
MPFDDDRHDDRNNADKKVDKVIALLATEDRWCKFFAESRDGQRCLWGAMWAEDAATVLEPFVLEAIRQVTGHRHQSVDTFNDDPATTHGMVLQVLHQARQNIRSATSPSAPHYQWAPAASELGTRLDVSSLLTR